MECRFTLNGSLLVLSEVEGLPLLRVEACLHAVFRLKQEQAFALGRRRQAAALHAAPTYVTSF